MKKRSLSLLALLIPVLLMANPISKDDAKQKALAFISERKPAMARGAQQRLTLALTNDSYHVFNLGLDEGFVVVSGDDCTDDILGYADSGTFNVQDMPENLRAWLQDYVDQIAWMRANGVTKTTNSGAATRGVPSKSKISPLLKSKWNQGNPYNLQTPKKRVTGCVATAMAQIMYYWYKEANYETQLEQDIPAYYSERLDATVEGLSAPATFDWAHMTDLYDSKSTDTEQNAVAKLMKYCGCAVMMEYGSNSSGANAGDIVPALTDYFGYQSAEFAPRCNYTYDDWQELIYSDLAAGRPVLIGGQSTGGGHRFVCDGYDEDDYFHFNWGWSGSSDGYYKLALCNPTNQGIGGSSTDGAFYMLQSAVCCIHPTQTIPLPIEPMASASGEDLSVTSVDIPTLNINETADVVVHLKNDNKTTAFHGDISVWIITSTESYRVGGSIANIPSDSNEDLVIPITVPWVGKGKHEIRAYYSGFKLFGQDVTIGASLPNIEGTVDISDANAQVNNALAYQLSGKVSTLTASDHRSQWQISKNGKGRWEDIAGATSATYTPKATDAHKYVRVVVRATGYHGELVSDGREVLYPTLSGTVSNVNNYPSIGAYLNYQLNGKVASLDASTIHSQWQRSSNGQTGWTSIPGKESDYYILKVEDLGYYVRVKITATGYDGELCSTPLKCMKKYCDKKPVAPILEVSTAYNQVRVTNPQADQEYIILDNMKTVSSLSESDWKNAKTFGSNETILLMGGTVNKTNYVFTRVKETETVRASTDVLRERIYFGETIYVQDINLEVTKVVHVTNWFTNHTALEEDDYGAYYMTGGETYRIRVTALPVNATFKGVLGSKWLVNGHSRASQWGSYYSDEECTTPIDADTNYKTVYFKPKDNMPINYMELRAEYTKGYNDIATDAFRVNVASNDGTYKMDSFNTEKVLIGKGKKVAGLPYTPRPAKASIINLSATKTSGEGIAPVVTFNTATKYFGVDATDATKGTFYYKVYSNGSAVGSITVEVTTPSVEQMRLQPSTFTLDCGQSMQLNAQLFPVGAEEEITWTSSNESVATVSAEGVVTVKSNADIGATATITAKAGDFEAESQLTVPGKKYDLYLAGYQVTTRNMNRLTELMAELSDKAMESFFAGDMIISFDGEKTLRLKNAYIDATGKTAQGMTLGIEGMTVIVEGDCYLSSNYSGMKIARNATITGDGILRLQGHENGILYNGYGFGHVGKEDICLTVGNIQLQATGEQYGINGSKVDNHSLKLNHVQMSVRGTQGAIQYLMGDLTMNDCYITEPDGTEMKDGCMMSGGELIKKLTIVPFKSGDVNNDGKVNEEDVKTTVSYIMGEKPSNFLWLAADVNKDGKVNITDVTCMICIIHGNYNPPSIPFLE